MVLCRPHNPTGTVESAGRRRAVPAAGCPSTPSCCSTRPTSSSSRPSTGSTRLRWSQRFPECGGAADLFEGVRAGRAADRLWVRRARAGRQAVDHAAAVRHRHHRPGRGRGVLRRGKPAAATHSDDRRRAAYLRMRLRAMGVYSTDAHANFVYLPPAAGRGARSSTARPAGPQLCRRRSADHRRQPRVDAGGARRRW